MRPTDFSSLRYVAARGRRRSVSSRATRCPPCASEMARFTAVVDLPSEGTAEVMVKMRDGLSASTNCRLVRSTRNDSTRPEVCAICVTSGLLGASLSAMMAPSGADCVISSSRPADFTVLSSVSRSTASPKPRNSPSSAPRPMFSAGFGATGVEGSGAASTIVALIGVWPCGVAPSSSGTYDENTSAKVCESCCARAGLGSVAVISMITVLGRAVAEISSSRSAGLWAICSLSTTICATALPSIRLAYEAVRVDENCAPCSALMFGSETGVDTKSRVVDAYCGVVRTVTTAPPAMPISRSATIISHRRRITAR